MNKYLNYIEKQASLLEIPMSALRSVGKGIVTAGKGLGRMADRAAGSGYRQYVNESVYGGKASPPDLFKKAPNSAMAYRRILEKHRDALRAQGHKGPIFAKASRTKSYGKLEEEARAKVIAQGYKPREWNLERGPEKGYRKIEHLVQPERSHFHTLKKDQFDAKVSLTGIAGGSVLAGNALHNKIKEKMTSGDQYSNYGNYQY